MIHIKNKLQQKAEKLRFESKAHRYSMTKAEEKGGSMVVEEREFISVTTLISKYYPKFDPDGSKTARAAIKNGITPREQADLWEANGKLSADNGTITHKYAEIILNGGKLTPEQISTQKTSVPSVLQQLYDTYKDNILATEQLIYSEQYGIAGTVDLLTSDGKVIDIYDFKTNERYDKKGRDKLSPDYMDHIKMLPPLQNLPANNYYKFALQTSIYRYLLELDEFKVRMLATIHLIEKPEIKELPYLKEEVEMIIHDMVRRSD